MGSRDEGPSGGSWTVRDRRHAPPSRASAPQFAPGDVVLERYELREILGRGGMGIVFRAHDRVLDQEIAIKIVRAEYAGDRVWAQRLAREVRLARQINHPNVCRVFDVGQADAHPFLTMELARRGTLREEIAAGRAGPLERRLDDAKMIVSGLAAIHGAGIVHRDLAPQNVLRMDDGSLVVSDFGLATDRTEGASSVQGGTVAYMAPEVVRGASANVASDVWSLGVVIHECMFGVRPRWSPDGQAMLRPSLARPLNDVERKVFEICRACTSVSPDKRPCSAGRVADALSNRRPLVGRFRHSLAGYAAALLIVAGILAALARSYLGPGHDGESKPLRASGPARDWTEKAKILATVPDRIHCLARLPDRRTVRFVWGSPAQAEDLDTHTGQRVASPLVPSAYAEGCPDVARDGSKIVFAGHDRDLRPAAFVSTHLDGRDAVPVVAAGERSLSTDPAWLPDNESFLYPVDLNHSAIFSMTNRTSMVVPADTHLAFTTGYQVVGDSVIVSSLIADETIVHRLRLPHFEQDLSFRVAGGVLQMATPDARFYYLVSIMGDDEKNVMVVDSKENRVVRSASIADRHVRYPTFVDTGLTVVATWSRPVLVVTSPDGRVRRFNPPPDVTTASACGDAVVALRGLGAATELVRLDWSGRLIGRMGVGLSPRGAACSRDGRVVYYHEWSGGQTLMRCEDLQCRPIYRGPLQSFDLSPANDRIVLLAVGDDGLTVRWMGADGQGPGGDIAKTDVPCFPGWSSEQNVWIATHRGADVVWKELVARTGKPTGVTAPGSWDCMDGVDDPQSPVFQRAKIVLTRRSEVRLISSSDLRNESAGRSP